MNYVMSDIHGCYDKYLAMLEKIDFSSEDTLYILGDVIDRGDNGIDILLDMMKRRNVIPMLGNHELMAFTVLEALNVEITEENYSSQISDKVYRSLTHWTDNGGYPTYKAFTALNYVKRKRILDYINDFIVYKELTVNGRDFLLVHAGLDNFSQGKPLEDYSIKELVWYRCNYNRVYFEDKYLVTGHTPTFYIDPSNKGRIYRKNFHIAIDCGAVFGNPLSCICLDTLEEYYV
ncbi:MAG: hypothetical protein E7591_00350 [Ruminococcaceae bacterium]|nr:hypothetical protein [Oscillospiraceae bacterium]